MRRMSSSLAAVARALRAMLGAPDYERYLLHARECHPHSQPLTRDEFFRERLDARYSKPGSRCC